LLASKERRLSGRAWFEAGGVRICDIFCYYLFCLVRKKKINSFFTNNKDFHNLSIFPLVLQKGAKTVIDEVDDQDEEDLDFDEDFDDGG
jgi:hypothetical protein